MRYLALAALLAAGCQPSRAAGDGAAQPDPRAVVAWVVPYDDSLQSLARNAQWVTVASPTYFRLAVAGKAVRLEDWDPGKPFPRAQLAAIRQRARFEVIPLVGCIGPCGPQISRVLDDDAARAQHVADLLRTARDQQLDGLFIDYEDVDAREASVTRFVDDLSAGLHAAGKKLGLVVQEPCGADPACKRNPYPFALGTLVRKVDMLAVMEYDFAVDGSAPPAPRAWVERGLSKVVAEVGKGPNLSKVLCAVPLYGRVSTGIADDTAVLFTEVSPGRVRNAQATIGPLTFDPSALSKVAGVSTAAKSGTLFLEDRETLAARLALVTRYRIGGVALWRLGSEDPCVSTELARFRRMPLPPCQ